MNETCSEKYGKREICRWFDHTMTVFHTIWLWRHGSRCGFWTSLIAWQLQWRHQVSTAHVKKLSTWCRWISFMFSGYVLYMVISIHFLAFLGCFFRVQVHFSHSIDHGRPAEHNWTLSSPFRTQLVCVDHWRHWVVFAAGRTEHESVSRIPSITSSMRQFRCCLGGNFLKERGLRFLTSWRRVLSLSRLFEKDFSAPEGPISHTLSTPVVQVGSVARGGDEVWLCYACVVFLQNPFDFVEMWQKQRPPVELEQRSNSKFHDFLELDSVIGLRSCCLSMSLPSMNCDSCCGVPQG